MEVNNPKQAIHVVAASDDLQKPPIGALLVSGPSLATLFPPVSRVPDGTHSHSDFILEF